MLINYVILNILIIFNERQAYINKNIQMSY